MVISMPGLLPHRRDTLKCQMGFGRDFAPPLLATGIWDAVYAIDTDDITIQDVQTRPRVAKDPALLSVTVETNARRLLNARLRYELAGETFEAGSLGAERAVEFAPGVNRTPSKC
jgi:hypothetical protein